jgi:hypothetical protein
VHHLNCFIQIALVSERNSELVHRRNGVGMFLAEDAPSQRQGHDSWSNANHRSLSLLSLFTNFKKNGGKEPRGCDSQLRW